MDLSRDLAIVADTYHHKIKTMKISTGELTFLAGSGAFHGRQTSDKHEDGVGAAATFARPNSVTALGNIALVADGVNNAIRKVELSTGKVTTLGGFFQTDDVSWAIPLHDRDGLGTIATFNGPSGICMNDNFALVMDAAQSNAVRVITPQSPQ